ncbi:MAG: hypothetical protein HY308_05620 [Gammaproteobacteria bacterium]|nr:hypothetical protein [Gammaproteobacteria bacterium]
MAVLTVTLAVAAVGACNRHEKLDIAFAPYGDGYSAKPDFAEIEHQYPLSLKDLEKITPENLAVLDQEQVDQIYARLTAGPIPDGAFDGNLFFPKGTSGERRLTEIIGGIAGRVVEFKASKLETIGRTLWKGKVFYRNDRLLRNRIDDLTLIKPLIQGDTSTLDTITVNGKTAWLLFPAKLYCGQSLLDARRESIIIDYAYSEELPGYRERPDFLAGRHGLMIRDEIRMIHPGFYLGRAYAGKVFLLNFTLYNKEIADRDGPAFAKSGQVAEDCWRGTQRATVAAK